jgi:hypothetical protein
MCFDNHQAGTLADFSSEAPGMMRSDQIGFTPSPSRGSARAESSTELSILPFVLRSGIHVTRVFDDASSRPTLQSRLNP